MSQSIKGRERYWIGWAFEGTVVDISTGGVRILADETVPEGSRLILNFKLPVSRTFDGVPSKVVKVIEQDGGRVFLHVMFLEISEDQRNGIMKYSVAQQRKQLRMGLIR